MGTTGLQQWLLDNAVPVVLLVVAVGLLFAAMRGDNAKGMKVFLGVLLGLVVLGLAVSGQAPKIGSQLWALFT